MLYFLFFLFLFLLGMKGLTRFQVTTNRARDAQFGADRKYQEPRDSSVSPTASEGEVLAAVVVEMTVSIVNPAIY